MTGTMKEESRTALEKTVGALEVPGSHVRNGILEGVGWALGQDLGIDGSKINSGEKYMTSAEFITRLAGAAGFDYDTHGSNPVDKVLKFGLELAVDVATDPLMLLPTTAGFKGAKLASKYLKGVASPTVLKAIDKGLYKTLYRGAVGAGVGAMAPVSKSGGNSERLHNALIGGGATMVAAPLIKNFAQPALRKSADWAVDAYFSKAHPEIITEYSKIVSKAADLTESKLFKPSEQHKVAKDAIKAKDWAVRAFNEVSEKVIERHGLDAVDAAMKVFDTYVPKMAAEREIIWKELKKSLKGASPIAKARADRELTRQMNRKYVDIIAQEGKWTPAAQSLAERNMYMTDIYNSNKAMKWLEKHGHKTEHLNKYDYKEVAAEFERVTGRQWEGMEPMVIHTPEIFSSAEMKASAIESIKKKAGKNFKEGFNRRTSGEAVRTGGLNAQSRMADENTRIIFKMLDKEERLAASFISELNHGLRAGQKNGWVKALNAYDAVNTRMKGNLLTMTHKWIQNNFKENVIRTFAEDGLIAGASAVGKQSKAIMSMITGAVDKEMSDLMKVAATENAATAYIKGIEHNGAVNVARRYGAINGNLFQDIMHKSATEEGSKILTARMGVEEHKEALAKLANRNKFLKGYDSMLAAARDTIGATGSLIENATRLRSWEHGVDNIASASQKKLIKELGYADAVMKDQTLHKVYQSAGDRVNKIFFDYSDLSLGEEELLKRVAPFYSFYGKNITFWGEYLSDAPAKFAKYVKAPVHMTNMDSSLDKIDMTVPDYVRESFHGKASDGRELTEDKASVLDAMKLRHPIDYAGSVVNPILKNTVNVGHALLKKIDFADEGPTNTFGGKILPSESFKGVRNSAYGEKKWNVLDDLFIQTVRKEDGRFQNSSDTLAIVDTATSGLTPPILDTMAAIYESGDMQAELSPVKINRQTPTQKVKTLKRAILNHRKRLKQDMYRSLLP